MKKRLGGEGYIIGVAKYCFQPLAGKSDPYCKMVILNKQHIGEKIVQKSDIKAWVEGGLVKGEGVVQSSVKHSTLEPEWGNEVFDL